MRYMEKIMEWFMTAPGKESLIDAASGRTMTYGELDKVTSKVYAYLLKEGIGREDFVMIDLPRGIDAIAVIIGVWRAGAAYVIVEEGTTAEKKDYIYKDLGCKFILGLKEYDEILETPGREGYAETGLHDACYAIYTSGTTGNPKGVLHEYGTLEENALSLKYGGDFLTGENDRFLFFSPLSFVAGPIIFGLMTYHGTAIIMVPLTVVRDKDKLLTCMSDYRITETFLTPSYLRMNPSFNPDLKRIFISSEPAKDIFRGDITLYNTYFQSESGYLLAIFKIDRVYDITPVGKPPRAKREIVIRDDDGKKAAGGEHGELCFDNPYFRGYINLPQENEMAFRGGIYHSGDMGEMLSDGNIVLKGRSDDMVKVNGSRVEPGEIENAVKNVLDLSWAAVKIFVDGGSVAICAYYTENIEFDHAMIKQKLRDVLPSYMVPTHFMRLDEIPLNANGKLSRKDLPRPEFNKKTVPYSEPQNDIEKRICEAAGIVLDVERVGATDDLYELGIDSIGAISLITEIGIEGLTAGMVFRGLTAREIAKIYQREVLTGAYENILEQEIASRGKEHPLLPQQLAIFDWQLRAPYSTMNNLTFFYRLGSDMELPRLAAAIENVMKAHDVFSTFLSFNEDGVIVQKYDPEIDKRVVIEKITEAELADVKGSLIRHYKLIGRPLYRLRIFETEKAGYLFFDVHHLIFDGTSLGIFLKDLLDSYEGKQIKEDHYFAYLSRTETVRGTEIYREAGEFYSARENEHDWSRYPRLDGEVTLRGLGTISFTLPVYEDGLRKLKELYSIGKNACMIAASVLSLAAYNEAEHISLQWVYNGRETVEEENVLGMLIRDIILYIDLEKGMTLEAFFKEIRKQVRTGLSYSCYPHYNLMTEPSMSLFVLYQSWFDEEEENKLPEVEEQELPNPYDTNEALIDLEIYDEEETRGIVTYVPSCYKEESVNRFCRMIKKSLELLVKYAEEPVWKISHLVSVIKDES